VDIKEIFGRMSNTFFVTFFLIVVIVSIDLQLNNIDSLPLHNIFAIVILTLLTTLCEFVLYSKKELTRSELLIRHFICLFLTIGIVLSVANFMRWISLREPMHVIIFGGLTFGIHVIVTLITFCQTTKSTHQLREKLKERYK